MKYILLTFCIVLFVDAGYCQNRDTLLSQTAQNISGDNIKSKTMDRLTSSYTDLNASIEKQSMNLLQKFQQKEAKLMYDVKESGLGS